MSILDPKSDADLRALARKSRSGGLSSNESAELEQATSQSGPLANELKNIQDGKA